MANFCQFLNWYNCQNANLGIYGSLLKKKVEQSAERTFQININLNLLNENLTFHGGPLLGGGTVGQNPPAMVKGGFQPKPQCHTALPSNCQVFFSLKKKVPSTTETADLPEPPPQDFGWDGDAHIPNAL